MNNYHKQSQDSSASMRFRRNVSLLIVLFFFAFANGVVFISTQFTNSAYAQTTSDSDTTETVPIETSPEPTEPVKAAPASSTASPTPSPTPRPAAATPVAKKPVPAYDRMTIPSIGLSSRYVPVGVTAQNNIDVHPSLVGIYTGGAQPGNAGAVFLDGHNPGVFSALPSIGVGSQITLTKASGEAFTYTVVHTETVQLEGINMRRALRPYNGAAEGLNLMTCVGAYNPQTGTTDQRFVVFAVRS